MIAANKAYTEVKRPSVAPLPHPATAVGLLSSITFLETATVCIDNKLNVDTIYLRLAKAFDKVPHERFFVFSRLLFELIMLTSHYFFLVSNPCGRLSWLSVSFLIAR